MASDNNKTLIEEGIYLLQEERFIETNKNIYKIGRSGHIYKRVSQYENGTIVYLMIACNNSETIESNLLSIFNKDFKGVKYYGNEYFMGDLHAMKDTIIEYIKTTTNNDIKLINMDIKIETVDKASDKPIPKYKQELYSKAELTIIQVNKHIPNNINTNYKALIESLSNSIGNNLSKFKIDINITPGKFALALTDKNKDLPINYSVINNVNNPTNQIIKSDISGNIPYVYPFGYENINVLTEDDVLEILKSKDGANLVLEKIYSHIDNNNFMKLNKKDKHMAYINSANNIAYCKDKEFILKLYDQSELLLQRIFFQYFNRFSNEYKYIVWCNIQKINETLYYKSQKIANGYENLIVKKINNIADKKQFNIVKNGIECDNSKIISKNINVYNISSLNIRKLNDELNNKTLNLEEINQIWNELHSNSNASYEEHKNDLTIYQFEDTPRYKLIQTLIKKELEFINNSKTTMCDIGNIHMKIESRIIDELKLIRQYFADIDEEYIKEIKDALIIKPQEHNDKVLLSLKFNNNTAELQNN